MSEKTEYSKLDSAHTFLHAARSNINEILTNLEKIIDHTRADVTDLELQKKELEIQKRRLEERAKAQEAEITGLTQEQKVLLHEYEQVKVELEKFTKAAAGDSAVKFEDIRASLTIYRVLLEEVYQSQPHFKILLILHGDTEQMNLSQLQLATGFSGTALLYAVHELSRAHLIEFNEDTHMVTLIKRFFPKREK